MSLDAIVSYLHAGHAPEEIATIVGCSPSYVSQVKARPDYPDLLQRVQDKAKVTALQTAREIKYETTEDKVLRAMEAALPMAEFRDMVRALEMLHKRKQPNAAGMIVHNQTTNIDASTKIVQFTIPAAAAPEIVINGQREVVAVGDMSLAPMSSHEVKKLFHEMGKAPETPEAGLRPPVPLQPEVTAGEAAEEPVLTLLPEERPPAPKQKQGLPVDF